MPASAGSPPGPQSLRSGAQQTEPHCGIDLIEIDRVAGMVLRYGTRILDRVWTTREQEICRGRFPELAARFAAKEAAAKALGTGVRGLAWREVEIERDGAGKPVLVLHGGAAERARAIGALSWSVSLTHSRTMACAVVVMIVDGVDVPTADPGS